MCKGGLRRGHLLGREPGRGGGGVTLPQGKSRGAVGAVSGQVLQPVVLLARPGPSHGTAVRTTLAARRN